MQLTYRPYWFWPWLAAEQATIHHIHQYDVFISLWPHQMKTFSTLLTLCAVTRRIPCTKSQWRRAFIFSLICAWINDWVNNREAGDLGGHHAHYDVSVMLKTNVCVPYPQCIIKMWHKISRSSSINILQMSITAPRVKTKEQHHNISSVNIENIELSNGIIWWWINFYFRKNNSLPIWVLLYEKMIIQAIRPLWVMNTVKCFAMKTVLFM